MNPLNTYKQTVENALVEYFERIKPSFHYINFWGNDIVERLKDFTLGGKMLRGSLILFTEEMLTGSFSKNSIEAAISLELLHSGLLIHDDIMDKDEKRRGKETIYYQYSKMFNKDSYHNGMSMGICTGDFAFFLAFENLNRIEIEELRLKRIISLFSREMSHVCLGQMEDIFLSNTDTELSENRILSMYLYKTSRYTFSLPMMIGGILGRVEEKIVRQLEYIGENLGLIFQIKDDELGIFGSMEETGKPIGSDIREGKKTLCLYLLYNSVNNKERKRLSAILKKKRLKNSDIEEVQKLIKAYKIDTQLRQKIDGIYHLLKNQLEHLDVPQHYKQKFASFIEYNLSRNR